MKIRIIGPPDPAGRLRAYAEYRVFSRLAPLGRDIVSVRVVLTRSLVDGSTRCALHAALRPDGSVQARSRRSEPTRAIDDAAEKLAAAAWQRLGHASPDKPLGSPGMQVKA